MSAAAIVMMIFILLVVWGGAGWALWLTWRQEQRDQARSDFGDGLEDPVAGPPGGLT
jgi:hypothetical protein